MNQLTAMANTIKVVGIDLSKAHFQVHAADRRARAILQKSMTRQALLGFVAHLPAGTLIAMEACAGAHHLARHFIALGHSVRLIAPQFVKPYVRANKHDRADAEAIVEAATRPAMRFVAVKSVEQQDLQALHRARALAVTTRTAQVNQIRGFLLERGIALPKGRACLRARLPALLDAPDTELGGPLKALLAELYAELVHLDSRIEGFDRMLAAIAKRDADCARLLTVPGIGPLTATALTAALGEAHGFKRARHLAAWLGLVPRQHSTGGRARLYGISKRGDAYLRTLLIHGARSVLAQAGRKHDRLSVWALRLAARRGRNVATVALAHKLARTAHAVLTRGERYRDGEAPAAGGMSV